jgi:hypothetical protein
MLKMSEAGACGSEENDQSTKGADKCDLPCFLQINKHTTRTGTVIQSFVVPNNRQRYSLKYCNFKKMFFSYKILKFLVSIFFCLVFS